MAEGETGTATQAAMTPREGEPCESCGAPLAADQRYCLECGQRRGGPRVDYRHYMAAAAAPAGDGPVESGGAVAASAAEPEQPQRDYAPLAAVGGIAVLGLMLLVGVLIGKGDGGSTATPTPQVVTVQGGEADAGSKEAGGEKNTAGGLGGGNSKKAKGGSKGGDSTGNATKASEGDLEALGGTSGEDYVKQSENLPNEIATEGTPAPIDKSKPAGGGEGGGEVIK